MALTNIPLGEITEDNFQRLIAAQAADFAFLRREAAVCRGCAGRASGAVGRDAQDAATSGLRTVVSLSGHIPVPHRR